MANLRVGHKIWQVSAGASDRSYADQFLEYGVALIGPGDAGPWHSGYDEHGFVERFASELQKGDVLLLRTGTSVILVFTGSCATGRKIMMCYCFGQELQ